MVPSTGLFAAADGLIPDGLNVDGMNYRSTVGNVSPAAVDVRVSTFLRGRAWRTPTSTKSTLMIPAGSGLTEAAETINGAWQKELSLFFSIEEVDEETFQKRLSEGDYTIALAPHQRRERQRIQYAGPVHHGGREFDRLRQCPLRHPTGGQHPRHRRGPLPAAGRV